MQNQNIQTTATLLQMPAGNHWMRSTSSDTRVISHNERTSLSALISYVATGSDEHEFGIERRLADRFNIPNVNFLPASQYDAAIRYLVDGMRRAA